MKKGLLIYRINKDDIKNSGVVKKCLGQIDAFRRLGVDIDVFWLSNEGIVKNDMLVHKQKLKPNTLSLYWFYLTAFGWHILKYNDFENYDFIYLRHPFFDPILVKSLKKVKNINRKLKLILEINTYPYDEEPKRFLHKRSLWLDKIYRNEAHKFVDRIVHYGAEAIIWDIPTIPIRNGIQVDRIKVSKRELKEKKLRLIAVGNWSYWHGLDRIIKGLGNYYKNRKNEVDVSLEIVGNYPEELNFKKIIADNRLDRVVKIVPPKYGNELDDLFNETDVGIGTLAIHRKGVTLDSSLKHREYCARGIPFILAGKDPDFDTAKKFVYKISANDDPVNIEKYVEYYFRNELSNRTADIRAFAEENLDWSSKMKPVTDWIKEL